MKYVTAVPRIIRPRVDVPDMIENAKITAAMPGRNSRKKIRPKEKLPARLTPQFLLSRLADSFTASIGPLLSTTRTGIARKVMIDQAAPSRPAMMLPTFLLYDSMIFSVSPTVADTSAQPAIRW